MCLLQISKKILNTDNCPENFYVKPNFEVKPNLLSKRFHL